MKNKPYKKPYENYPDEIWLMPGLDKNKFFDALQNWPSQPTLAELKEQKEFLVKALDIIIRLPDIAREERTQILIHIVDAIRNIDEQIKIKKAKK